MSDTEVQTPTSVELVAGVAERAERRLLIDGKLIEPPAVPPTPTSARPPVWSSVRPPRPRPTTCAAAIAAARRAFDETDWSSNRNCASNA